MWNSIIDAIYNENYRLALNLSNKALKKFHNDPAVNVNSKTYIKYYIFFWKKKKKKKTFFLNVYSYSVYQHFYLSRYI